MLVVGGGYFAFERARSLVAYGAEVIAVDETFVSEYNDLANCIRIYSRYEAIHVRGKALVMACSPSILINEKVVKDCDENNILCFRQDGIGRLDNERIKSGIC